MKKKIPLEVQKYIDFLDEYKENNESDIFDIIHMYSEGIAYPNGYYDSQFFTLVCFNTKKMEKKVFESRDGLRFDERYGKQPKLEIIRIFADGSTLIKFRKFVKLLIAQEVTVIGTE